MVRLLFIFNKYLILLIIINFSGVEVKFKQYVYPVLIQPIKIKELCEITELESSIRIGSSVTLDEMEKALRSQIKIKPGIK